MEDNLEWKQELVIHCPEYGCDGMLLQSGYRHEMKCSKCGCYWININSWRKVDKLID